LLSNSLIADSKIGALQKSLQSAREDTNKIDLMNNLVTEWITIGNYPQADSLALEELELSERLNFKKGLANAYNSLGVACSYQGDYSQSLQYLFKSLNLYEELNAKRGQAIALKYMGTVYSKEGDSTDAITYLHKALHIFTELKDTNYIATALLSVGNLYEAQGDHSTAIAHIARSLELFKMINEKDGIASSLMYMGDIYNNRNDYPQSLDYYNQAIPIFTELGDKAGLATIYASLGKLYAKQGDYKKALDYENNAITMAKEIGALDEIQAAEMELSTIYEKQGDGQSALEHYKAYTAIRDTIFNQQNTQRAIREEMNLEFEKKQATTKAEFEEKEAIHKEEVRKKQITIYFVSGIMLLAFGFAGFAYRSNLKKMEAHKIIAEKNQQITESINYAERIQQAVLPAKEDIAASFPDNFVLYMPKDIVSGDFYFFYKNQERTILAVADCTGHGIPGAFMSMMCSEKLSDIAKTNQGTGEILKKLNAGLKSSLHQSDAEGSTQDGMDVALCAITPSVNGVKLSYSGANRPLWVIPKGKKEIHELVPTKKSVGTFTNEEEDYSTYVIQLQQGDTFYMFTDGYTDQFGGEEGKKLTAKKFGELLLSIHEKPMPEQEKELTSYLKNWKKDMAQQDDILVIGVRV
jgi:serine phosphatase RsbU (regulator of sigma subunit)/uncharacterized protein HemY